MALKPINPDETYIVREVFSCGAGHFPGIRYTHWEAGECCLFGHDEGEDPHLYTRRLLVPLKASDEKTDLWELLLRPENENKWGQFPLAPDPGRIFCFLFDHHHWPTPDTPCTRCGEEL